MAQSEYNGIFRKQYIPLEEFPGLFVMESHTGLFGAIFTGVWVTAATISHASLRPLSVIGAGAAIASMFVLLMGSATQVSATYTKRVLQLATAPDATLRFHWGVLARRRIAALSASYAFICCCLIYLTGGVLSPFISFYIMTFTLTINRTRVPWALAVTLTYFAAIILAACGAYETVQWPISEAEMHNFEISIPQKVLYYLFLGLSLAVPTFSTFYVARKEAKDQAEALKKQAEAKEMQADAVVAST